jgi:hypothetical protein
VRLPRLAGQPLLSGPDRPPPANRRGPPGVSQAEAEAPLSPMCPGLSNEPSAQNGDVCIMDSQ